MKRWRKLSDAAQSELLFIRKFTSSNPKALTHSPITKSLTLTSSFIRKFCTQSTSSSSNSSLDTYEFFADRWSNAEVRAREALCSEIAQLREELVGVGDDDNAEEIKRVLEEKGSCLFRIYPRGEAFIELLDQLVSFPSLAITVSNWRRQADYSNPLTSEEYAKLIWLAGKMRNLDLAVEIFMEACNKRIKTSSTYNALMTVYMWHGLVEKCQSLFQDLKRESTCGPTIVTYNILISAFGRSVLPDHMDAMFQEVKDLKLSPNLSTYNYLIVGYLTAWMWESVERTYRIMEASTIKPNLITHFLLLRGYAFSGQLDKMEEIYNLVKHRVNSREFSLIRAMICAYSKSSDINRVKKIEALVDLIPEHDYRAWLNVILIKLYAKEGMLDKMESSIDEALKHNTPIVTVHVMRCIITNYFQHNSVDRLSNFVKRAEEAGWKICRSLYHCKMAMYSAQNRLDEMESVLDEMEKYNMYCCKKTFLILYKGYSAWGQRHKALRVLGLMCKHGYGIPS